MCSKPVACVDMAPVPAGELNQKSDEDDDDDDDDDVSYLRNHSYTHPLTIHICVPYHKMHPVTLTGGPPGAAFH